MKFTEVKRWKVREMWLNKNRRLGIASYILHTPQNKINQDEFYHFEVKCYKCKNSNIKCNNHIQYSSLDDELKFETYESCKEAVETWHTSRN